MIILITGASHTGKTLLAQRLLEQYHYPYLSVDHLKMGLIRSGNTDLTPMDDDKLTDYLWPIVREMVKTAIENEYRFVFFQNKPLFFDGFFYLFSVSVFSAALNLFIAAVIPAPRMVKTASAARSIAIAKFFSSSPSKPLNT